MSTEGGNGSEDGCEALEALVPLVYSELKTLARRQLRGRHDTLFTTELVHEAYLKLAGHSSGAGRDRAHFYSLVVRTMKQVLVDHARKRAAQKRGGGRPVLRIRAADAEFTLDAEELLALDAALDRLKSLNERLRQLVDLRFFAGLDEKVIADMLGVSVRTVQRDWVKARLILHRELHSEEESLRVGHR